MSLLRKTLMLMAGIALSFPAAAQDRTPHNLILFVPDGLRALSVAPDTAPTMAAIRDRGVNFRNPHSLFPTFTMPNSSGMSSGHHLGDTSIYSNTIYSGYPVGPASGSVTPFIENDAILGDIDAHFAGNVVSEEAVLKVARERGLGTAIVGKVGPALMFDHTERSGKGTIVVDDATGSPAGVPLSDEMKEALGAAGLPLVAPGRGANGGAGAFDKPGTTVANVQQQKYFADVATKVVLPMLKARNKPFVLVFWSRDPDGTQHNQGDSLNAVVPGINGPTSAAAIRNADDNLKQVRDALRELGLADDTNIIVAADHGFSTISKESATSSAAKVDHPGVPKGLLPPGFVALDLAKGLGLPLFDPDARNARVNDGAYPARGNGLLGNDPEKPDVVVAANGGSDLVYLPARDPALASRVVDLLLAQDYVSGLFVDDDLGEIAGTLPLSAISLKGIGAAPRPSIVVNFRSYSTGCAQPTMCAVTVADTGLQQGQGMHGSFSRADTMNFMAAIGPDFKPGFADDAPISNADVGRTMAHLLGLKIARKGELVGRVAAEALRDGMLPETTRQTIRSKPAAGNLATVLVVQQVGPTRYFDVAGFPGRTVGLDQAAAAPQNGQASK